MSAQLCRYCRTVDEIEALGHGRIGLLTPMFPGESLHVADAMAYGHRDLLVTHLRVDKRKVVFSSGETISERIRLCFQGKGQYRR